MARAWRLLGATAACCALLGPALSGCATDQQDSTPPAGVANRVAEEATGPQALLEGTVTQIEGCFYVESENVEGGLAVSPSSVTPRSLVAQFQKM